MLSETWVEINNSTFSGLNLAIIVGKCCILTVISFLAVLIIYRQMKYSN